jgi:exosortase/archaeosortase family protein
MSTGGSDDRTRIDFGLGDVLGGCAMTQVVRFEALPTTTLRTTVRKWRHEAQERWHHASPRARTTVQMAVLLGVIVFAYNYSLSTLVQNAGLETPLAYVSLVPAIALALAALRARPMRPEPAIHDRQVDYIVGLPLVGGALAANLFLPSRMSAMFWVWRIDLLTLPVFVAGAVAIIFGVRVLWRQKLAVGYLFLAWPYPYTSVLLRVLDAFTRATLYAIREIIRVVPVAKSISSPDGPLFVVTHHGQSFPLSIVSACSGVNSVVGFLLIGSAFGAVVRGPMVRKVLWLAGGMLLLWAINLGRITFIFWAGKTWGERVAIGVLHPFIGLLTFSLGVALMVLLIRPLGMHLGMEAPGPALPPVEPQVRATTTRAGFAVPKLYAAIIVVTVAAVVLGISNFGLKTFNLVADASGQPKLEAYIASPSAPVGWRSIRVATYDWAKPLFGDTSVWDRYMLHATEGGDLHTTVPVIADVIMTPDLASFSAYGVEACYQFHGYSLQDVARVDIGGGITGQSISYTSQQYGSWSIVYWIIPVKLGTSTTYQRTVLYVQNAGPGVVVPATAKTAGIYNVAGSLGSSDLPLVRNRAFLVAFAREMINAETGQSTQSSPAKGATVGTATAAPPSNPAVDPAVSLSTN